MSSIYEPAVNAAPRLVETPLDSHDQHAIADAALFFAESLDLTIVLDRVAQRVAALCGGVCQVRFTPARRLKETHHTIAEPGPAAAWTAGSGPGESYSELLALLDELHPPPAANGNGLSGNAPFTARSSALLITPLIARGRRIGTIDVLLPALLDTDLSSEQRRIQALAAHAALAIDTAATVAQAQATNPQPPPAPHEDSTAPVLAMLTHDLRSPLTAVDSSTQLLERAIRSAQELDRNSLTRLVALARSGVAQLKAQVDALSRPRTGQPPRPTFAAITPIDLVHVIRLIAHFYEQTTSRHQITVSSEVAAIHGPWTQAHLERMIGNLLDNGIKYSPEGGTIQISVSCEQHAGNRWATLSICNAGIGIPQTDLARIAQGGYRAHNVGAIPGTGFGLASVRELVEQYAGTLAIRSVLNGTTTVQIRLPCE